MTTMSKTEGVVHKVYPETGAGGFAQVDGTIDFYVRVNALVKPWMTLLDYGAGRGQVSDANDFRSSLAIFKGRVAKIVGADVDDAVLQNPIVDEAHVISTTKPLPFADETFDLIFSDWVLEHVDNPDFFAAEAWRVLKPGGWFCARTPNRWGMTGIGANLVPNSLHVKVLKKLQPDRRDVDVFPTTYKLNTKARLRRYFTPERWNDFSYMHSSTPGYLLQSRVATELGRFVLKHAPDRFATNLHVFLQKKGTAEG